MKKNTSLALGLSLLGLVSLAALAADQMAEHPVVSSLDKVKWGPAPPTLPPGAQASVMAGDPSGAGLVTVRLKMPPGYVIPPHSHPSDEHVTVLSGSLTVGLGEKMDTAATKTLTAGGHVLASAKMNHLAMSKDGAVVQISLVGPYAIDYVNPADDPRNKAGKMQ